MAAYSFAIQMDLYIAVDVIYTVGEESRLATSLGLSQNRL